MFPIDLTPELTLRYKRVSERNTAIAPYWVTFSTGSLLAISLLENVGRAEVEGFYRFPSFESCEAERCQRDYSAMNVKRLKSKLAKEHARGKPLMMGGIPIDRFYAYENTFFKKGLPVLQGIRFPLKKKFFASGNIHLEEEAKVLGAPPRGMDARNLSYALGEA